MTMPASEFWPGAEEVFQARRGATHAVLRLDGSNRQPFQRWFEEPVNRVLQHLRGEEVRLR